MNISGTNTRTINDLVPDVIDMLQGRTDVSTIVPKYLVKAIREITESTPFEELRRTGPQFTLTTNTSVYPVTSFLNPGDDVTFVESFAIFIDFPTNTVEQSLKYKTPNAIEVMMSPVTVGPPAYWSRFGSNIHLAPNPDKNYTVFMRYQVRHPFPDQTDATSLNGAKVLIPDTWEEVVIMAAALRIAMVKRWNDQAKYLHDMLYGDPEYVASEGKRGRPGLIAARLLQVERDQMFSTRQLGITVPRYNVR